MEIPPPPVLKQPLYIPQKTLMGPGPANISPRVLNVLNLPILGHLHPECCQIMDEIKEGIQYLFQTRNELTLAISGSGNSGIEATLCNLLEPGDAVVIAVNGIWGERACSMASRCDAKVHRLDAELGNNFTFDQIEEALAKYRPVLFFIVHAESSTGVYQPLEGLGPLCHKYNCLLAVDAVVSAGALPLYMDKWDIDVVFTTSQKVLSAPPGLTPMSFSKAAQNHIFKRKTPVKVFYWDMTVLGDYWSCFGRPRVYHHTISSTLLYGLREALAVIAEEGLKNSYHRHKACAKKLQEGLEAIGLEFLVQDKAKRLGIVTTVKVPPNINWRDVHNYAMKYHLLEITGGLGPTTDKVFRIGVLGHNATTQNVDFVIKVLKEALSAVPKQSHL